MKVIGKSFAEECASPNDTPDALCKATKSHNLNTTQPRSKHSLNLEVNSAIIGVESLDWSMHLKTKHAAEVGTNTFVGPRCILPIKTKDMDMRKAILVRATVRLIIRVRIKARVLDEF